LKTFLTGGSKISMGLKSFHTKPKPPIKKFLRLFPARREASFCKPQQKTIFFNEYVLRSYKILVSGYEEKVEALPETHIL